MVSLSPFEGSPTSHGAQFTATDDVVVYGCRFVGNYLQGTYLSGCNNFSVGRSVYRGNAVENAGNGGAIGVIGGGAEGGVISDNAIDCADLFGGSIEVNGQPEVAVSANRITRAPVGISVGSNAPRCTVADNVVEGSTTNIRSSGLSVSSSDACTVTGNTITGFIETGLDIFNSSRVVSCANVVRNTRRTGEGDAWGIRHRLGSSCIYVGNRAYDDQGTPTQKYGFTEASGGSNLVFGNDFTGNTDGAVATWQATTTHFLNAGAADTNAGAAQRGLVLQAATVAAVGAMASPDAPAAYLEASMQTELDKLKANDDELKAKLDAVIAALKASGAMQ